jgi:uncharacterized protein YodC (DUF2158 family)
MSKTRNLGGCMDFKLGDLDFKAGDLVRLISGSQRMTVEEVGTGTVVCVWRDKGQIRRETFSTTVLEKVKPGSGPVPVGGRLIHSRSGGRGTR